MADARYTLEIRVPSNEDEVLASYDSDAPFMAVHAGDLLNGGMVREDGKAADAPLIVTHVEHFVSNGPQGMRHRLAIFTKREKQPTGFRIGGG